jgi:aminopeptidase N
MRPSLLPVLVGLLAACQALPGPDRPRTIVRDEHSFAEPNRVRVVHASLDLTLDFDAQVARGTAELALVRIDRDAPLVVDTDALAIEDVTGVNGTLRAWRLGPEDEHLGRALTIQLQSGDERVRIRYRTTAGTKAMQWLAPAMTTSGARPFLFTQGQSILTRSWIPLQDSPGVRITYDARVRCPAGLTALMSAEGLGRDSLGAFCFRLEQPVPPYLIALACGELEFRALSPRSGVWAEPGVIARAQAELADTEAMIVAAERLFGPYRWGRYDVLVLPPSFPYGGMENPTLTFATPTILAGDKSLVALIAHELAHSWSGNLVTNATWGDFWLNEGFTTYCENRIMEELYGAERAAMERVLEIGELEEELASLENWQELLRISLAGRSPEEGSTGVPYTKGALFLTRLEREVGRARFDAFLRGYFDCHAFRSITTQDFLDHLARELPEVAAAVDLDAWVDRPGLPGDAPRPTTRSLAAVDAQLAALASGVPAGELASEGWNTQQWLRFLRGLPSALSEAEMGALDAAFGFTRSGNSEIMCQWLELAVRHRYAAADARLEQFLWEVGRRKFLRPLYTALVAADAARARAQYARCRPRYHPVTRATLDAIVGWQG